jgi:hypothetical protein
MFNGTCPLPLDLNQYYLTGGKITPLSWTPAFILQVVFKESLHCRIELSFGGPIDPANVIFGCRTNQSLRLMLSYFIWVDI